MARSVLWRVSVPVLALLGVAGTRAQPVGTVTEADIERARTLQPVITDGDIERAQRLNRMPTEEQASRVPVPSAPRIEARPRPAAPATVDLEAIAKGYSSLEQDSGNAVPGAEGALLVFVSFAMPEAALARLVRQAERAHATLLLRGFVDNSLAATAARVKTLIGRHKAGFQIDPQSFDRFSVSRVPTFVLVRAGVQIRQCDGQACFPADAFVSTQGDVSLDYALQFMTKRAPAFAREAAPFLKRLRG